MILVLDTDEGTFKRIPGLGDIPHNYSLDSHH